MRYYFPTGVLPWGPESTEAVCSRASLRCSESHSRWNCDGWRPVYYTVCPLLSTRRYAWDSVVRVSLCEVILFKMYLPPVCAYSPLTLPFYAIINENPSHLLRQWFWVSTLPCIVPLKWRGSFRATDLCGAGTAWTQVCVDPGPPGPGSSWVYLGPRGPGSTYA